MDNIGAEALLAFLSTLAERLGVQMDQQDTIVRLTNHAALYGLLDWMVRNRYDFFEAGVDTLLYGRPASTFVDYC